MDVVYEVWGGEASQPDFFPVVCKNQTAMESSGRMYDGWELILHRQSMIVLLNRDRFLGSQFVSCPFQWTLNRWYQVAVTYERGGLLCMYVDGVRQYEARESRSLQNTAGNPLFIGFSPIGLVEYANGNIDNVRIYNRALDSAEVRRLYTGDE